MKRLERHVVHRYGVALFSILLLSGCAARHDGPLAASPADPRTPGMTSGMPPAGKADSPGRQAKNDQPAMAPAANHLKTFGATVEASDPRLAAALLVEAVLPTAESHLRVAQEYGRLGILDFAFAGFTRALLKEPRMSPAHQGLARVWRDWGLPGSGLGAAHRGVYYASASASARNTLGTILDSLGFIEAARTAYREAAALDPDAGWALNNLCSLEYRLGSFDLARAYCESALQVAPALTAARNNLALTYAATGDLVRARAEFLAPGDLAAAEYNMGIVRLAGRDYVSAALAFERAIKARPMFTAAKDRAHAARMRVLVGER